MKNLLLPIFLSIILINGCVQTPQPDVPKRVSLLYHVANVGNDIVVNQDTISIDEVKILADKINILLVDDTILQTQPDAIVMSYLSQFDGQEETILSAAIGFEDFNSFQGINLFIDIPNPDDNIQDNDFFGNPTNFSFIIRGTYNNQDFTYRSDPTFERGFSFDTNVELTNINETLALRLTYDMEDIVIDQQNNQILNPGNPDNQSKIDSLLQEAIAVEGSAEDLL